MRRWFDNTLASSVVPDLGMPTMNTGASLFEAKVNGWHKKLLVENLDDVIGHLPDFVRGIAGRGPSSGLAPVVSE